MEMITEGMVRLEGARLHAMNSRTTTPREHCEAPLRAQRSGFRLENVTETA